MTLGDNSAGKENLQRKGPPQALRAMIEVSADTYVSMLNATLFPFFLYQQSLAMAMRTALGSLQSATGGTRQGTKAGNETHRQNIEPIIEDTQGTVETSRRSSLQQNVEVTGETAQESGVETTEQTPLKVDEISTSLSEPASLPPGTPDTVKERPPFSAPKVLDEPAAEAVGETDRGSREMSSRAEGESNEAYPGSAAPMLSPAQERTATAEDPLPAQEEKSPTDETITEELPQPPEVSDVELRPPPVPQNILDELPPPPVPQNILDELLPPPTLELLDEPTPSMQGEKTQVRVRRTTAAARRRAEEMEVDLAEVEGTGQGGQITVDDVRRKAQEGQS